MEKAVSSNKKEILVLVFLIMVALVLRTWRLDTDLLFHRDQGLHALGSWALWHDHQFKLLGHSTDVDGIYHGPLYYWLMAIPYALSGGNPAAASLFQIILEILSMPFLYLGLKKLFGIRTALLSITLYTVSYGLIGYSRWLSNVTPTLPLANIFLYQIVRIRKNKTLNIFLDSLIVGLVCQFNGAIGFGLLPYLIWYHRKTFKSWQTLLIPLALILPAIPLIIFDLRHHFVTTMAIYNFIFHGSGGIGNPLSPLYRNVLTYLQETNHLVSFPFVTISTILLVIGLIKLYKHPNRNLIYAYIILPLIAFAVFKRGAFGFFLLPILPLSLAVAVTGVLSLGKIKYSIFILIFLINIYYLPQLESPHNMLIPIGSANVITLQDRLNVIDWTYTQAAGKPFSLWIYTIPYYQDDPWVYLFNWYARSKYGYLPEYLGGFSPNDLKTSKLVFDYYEPDHDQAYRLTSWMSETKNNFGDVTSQYQSHDIFVEQREWKPAKINL